MRRLGASCSPPGSSSSTPSGAQKKARRSEEHTSELQSHSDLVCRLLLEKKKKIRRHCLSVLNIPMNAIRAMGGNELSRQGTRSHSDGPRALQQDARLPILQVLDMSIAQL